MDSSFQLDSSEHVRIYSKIIEPTSFLDTSPVEKPKLLIIGAQTGAGKSKIVELSIKEFADNNVVTVNTDDLRAYHPRFEEIITRMIGALLSAHILMLQLGRTHFYHAVLRHVEMLSWRAFLKTDKV